MFLRSADKATELCRAVGNPGCRVLLDVFDQAIAGHDVPDLLRRSSDVLGSVQLADGPGRCEPGSGDVDFRPLFDALDAVGYDGLLGMEHGKREPGREGERALINAYVALSTGRINDRIPPRGPLPASGRHRQRLNRTHRSCSRSARPVRRNESTRIRRYRPGGSHPSACGPNAAVPARNSR